MQCLAAPWIQLQCTSRVVVASILLTICSAVQSAAQQPRTAVLRGVVYDSLLTSAPLRNAEVFLDGTELSSTTDSTGRFVFENLAPGTYSVGVGHPALDSLGFASVRRRVVLNDGETLIQLGPPSDRALFRASCADGGEDVGLLMGSVRRAENGAPVGNAEVRAEWAVSSLVLGRTKALEAQTASVAVRSDASGRYLLCGVPSDVAVAVRATDGASASGHVRVDLRGRTFAPQQLEIGSAADTLRVVLVTGTIRGRDGAPIPDATVRVIGEPVHTTSNADGRYTLVLPRAGTVTLEARAIGFDPVRVVATARPGTPTLQLFTPQPSVQQLADLDVIADETGFNRRRTTHPRGIYITPAQIRQLKPERTEDAIRRASKALFPAGFAVPQILLLRGGRCVPTIFIDGVRFRGGVDPASATVVGQTYGVEPTRVLDSTAAFPNPALDPINFIYPLGGPRAAPNRSPVYRYSLPVDPEDVRGVEIYDRSSGIPPELAAQVTLDSGTLLRNLSCGVFIWTWRTAAAPKASTVSLK